MPGTPTALAPLVAPILPTPEPKVEIKLVRPPSANGRGQATPLPAPKPIITPTVHGVERSTTFFTVACSALSSSTLSGAVVRTMSHWASSALTGSAATLAELQGQLPNVEMLPLPPAIDLCRASRS